MKTKTYCNVTKSGHSVVYAAGRSQKCGYVACMHSLSETESAMGIDFAFQFYPCLCSSSYLHSLNLAAASSAPLVFFHCRSFFCSRTSAFAWSANGNPMFTMRSSSGSLALISGEEKKAQFITLILDSLTVQIYNKMEFSI